MDINDLNDDCLFKVFAHLSLNDILNLEFVCLRWKEVQQQICKRQSSIKLFGSISTLTSFIRNETIHFSQLQCCTFFGSVNDYLIISKLDWSVCRLLVSKFSNIKMLLISGCHISQSVLIEFMLCQWRQLCCLSLIHLMGDVCWRKVLPRLDTLPHLKHMALFGVDDELKLPSVLSQLEQFHLGRYEHSLLQVFTQLGGSIRVLGLYDSNLTVSCLSEVANLKSTIKHQVTHLAIKSDALRQTQAERNLLNFVCTNLNSLICLELFTEHGFRMDDLLALKQLPNLVELSLSASEKSDLTALHDLRDYAYASQMETIKVLNLDIDVDPSTLDNAVLLFPNVQRASVNFARICCSCPEFPEVIDIPPIVQNPVPVVDENALQQPPPQLPAAIEPPPAPEDLRIFEEDNCKACSERAMGALSSLHCLHKLTVTGARCKDSAIKTIEQCSRVRCLVFAHCVNYSLKQLLNVSYSIANASRPQPVRLLLNTEKFNKIIKLTQKPNNLTVENVDPIVDSEDAL